MSAAAKVAVCCGVGGTGKTTISAALAIGWARAGERVVVLTIDPARRLADALGIGALDNQPRTVALPDPGAGRLDALMLDRKGTWDQVIAKHAREETARRLMGNRYYRAVSTRLSGSHEYMAVEKLHELATSGAYDRIVVDTPPTQHVVDFFRAPDRVRGILDRSMLRMLIDPGGSLRGTAARGALSVVSRLAGDRVLGDIREFFELISEMSAGFRERSEAVSAILTSPETAYWLVTDANAPDRNDLLGFLQEIRDREMTFAGFLVNRSEREPTGPFPTRADLAPLLGGLENGEAAVEAALKLPVAARARAARQQHAVAGLVERADGAPAWRVPEVPGGVRSVEGLIALSASLPPNPPH